MIEHIIVVSDLLSGDPDMGERVYARALTSALVDQGAIAVSVDGPAPGVTEAVRARRTLLSVRLWRLLRSQHPIRVLYMQRSSLTAAGIVRCWVLKHLAGAVVVPLVFQPRTFGPVAASLLRGLLPPFILSASDGPGRALCASGLDVESHVLPAAVDGQVFHPGTPEERVRSRQAYGLSADAQIVLHVGHLNRTRNLSALIPLCNARGVQVVVVASSSTVADEQLAAELSRAGVHLIRGYVPDIADLYRAADAYVFPTLDPNGCIGLPVSVFEALATGLPVVTTRFGVLPEVLMDTAGVWFADDEADLQSLTLEALKRGPSILPLFVQSWSAVARQVVDFVRARR